MRIISEFHRMMKENICIASVDHYIKNSVFLIRAAWFLSCILVRETELIGVFPSLSDDNFC